ncbi:MAG: NUDIX hydrolase [Oscillospiraceae bacterium]|nr:NUDIX hydrolase [Oscillospiraceae bacterium]
MEIEEMNSTNWSQSVAGVCLKDGKVLLARHTYGSGKGKLIIPGGYVKFGELPEETLVREYLEETGIKVKAGRLLGIRFNEKDWYVVFAAEYIEGVAKSDGDENSEVVWMDIDDALHDDAVPGLTKALVECARKESGFHLTTYQTNKVRNQLYA